MASCQNYITNHATKALDASDMTDSNIKMVLNAHHDPSWWDAFREDPDRYAYLRRWAMVVRREARRRRLL